MPAESPAIGGGAPPGTARPELSVVLPAHDEQDNIGPLCDRLLPVLAELGLSWEVVFVDDGSDDATWQRITELHRTEPRIKGLRLARNFGHQYALFAGLAHATGRAVVSMDADLQHPPETIPVLVANWREGHRIVHTRREDPEDFGAFKRLTSRAYYRLFSFLSGVRIERGMADFRLLDRLVVDALLQFREAGLFLRGLVQWVGYDAVTVPYRCERRHSGRSSYGLWRMLKLAWHGISSFSIVPLRLGILAGILTSLVSFAWMAEALWAKLVSGTAVPGWASTVGIMTLLFGILFILIGLLGEYIGRILIQVRLRPRFLVASSVGVEAHATQARSTRGPGVG